MRQISRSQLVMIVGSLFWIWMGYMVYFTIVQVNVKKYRDAIYLPVVLRSAENLKLGATVYLQGVPVGNVGSLHYIIVDERGKAIAPRQAVAVKPARQFVLGILDLTRPVRIYPDYKIHARYEAVLSQKSIEILPGRADLSMDRLAGWNPLFFSREQVRVLRTRGVFPDSPVSGTILRASNIDDPLFQIASLISENRRSVRRITHNLAEITDKMDEGQGDVARLLNEGKLHDSTRILLEQAVQLVKEGRKGLEDLRETDSLTDLLGALVGIAFRFAGGG